MTAPMGQPVLFLLGTYICELLDDDDNYISMYLMIHMMMNNTIGITTDPVFRKYMDILSEDNVTPFRVNKDMFERMLLEINRPLTFAHRGEYEQIAPAKQLFIFLCYMANTKSMREIGQYFGIGKSTAHITIERAPDVFINKLLKVIKWPEFAAQIEIARDLQLRYGLPDIIGYFDGTHIRLSGCPKGDKDFINRKSYPSIQMQVVVDNNLLITDCYTGWAGCAHDARVFRNSGLYQNAETGGYLASGKIIVADSVYWLVTPFEDNGHLAQIQRRFNRVLLSGRQTVERAIGHLKGRFRRLQLVTIHEPELMVSLIVFGCILHNLCILSHELVEVYIDQNDNQDSHPNNFPDIFPNDACGLDRRQQLRNALH